jgi:hypothetical protein
MNLEQLTKSVSNKLCTKYGALKNPLVSITPLGTQTTLRKLVIMSDFLA